MITTDAIEILANRLDLTKKQTRSLLKKALAVFRDALADGTSFTIRGFGTFDLRERSERKSYNPGLKKWMRLPPRITVFFRAGSKLKQRAKEREKQ